MSGPVNALYHWSSAQSGVDLRVPSLQGVGTPTIVSAGTNSLEAVFRDMTGGVSRLYWNGSNWGSDVLGGGIMGWPSAAITFDAGAVPVRRVYAPGTDGTLYENAKHGTNPWSTWLSVSVSAGAGGTKLAGSQRAVIRSTDSAVTVAATRARFRTKRAQGWGSARTCPRRGRPHLCRARPRSCFPSSRGLQRC